MVGAGDLDGGRPRRSAGQLVEAQREALGAAAVVDEDDRRAVLADELEQLGVDRRPDRACASPRRPRRGSSGSRSPVLCSGSTIDSTGTWICRSSGLRIAGVDDPRTCRRGPTRKRPTSSSGFCVALRPMRCGSRPSSCSAPRRSSVSARCAPRLVAATAWISSTITASTPREHLARLRGEHQVQRLGRRDEDVRRRAAHRRALALRRVAGADRRRVRSAADPAQRRAQVALDVVGQRLERRDVDEARVRVVLGRRVGDEAVEPPQERGERLARAGGRRDEDVLAGGDRRPGLLLGRRRPLEGARRTSRGRSG